MVFSCILANEERSEMGLVGLRMGMMFASCYWGKSKRSYVFKVFYEASLNFVVWWPLSLSVMWTVVCSFLMCLFTILYVLHVVWFYVNCLLNLFAIFLGVVVLNLTVLSRVWVGLLLLMFSIVCTLWSHCMFRCSF